MTSFSWTTAEVEAVLGAPVAGRPDLRVPFSGVQSDSRGVQGGELFVALRGERFDGHDFVSEAVAAGAGGVVVQQGPAAPLPADVPVYRVDDTLEALGRLAAHRRDRMSARVVGITGSVGKTTTKNLTHGALSGSLRTHATQGNLNNRIGLPYTVLAAPNETEVLVLEMGTNEPGEIAALTAVASPDIGVITTVGEVHLEGLGTLEGVFQEKLALVRGLPPGGLALVGDEPPELADAARATGRTVRVAGTTAGADDDLRAEDLVVSTDGRFTFRWRGQPVTLGIPGRATVTAAALALGVADACGVDTARALDGIAAVGPAAMRGEVRRVGSLVLLVDCYNASPQSTRAAAELLEEFHTPGRRVAVLGSMLELGSRSAELHSETLAALRALAIDRFYLTGAFAESAQGLDDDRLRLFPDVEKVAVGLANELAGNEAVLIKGSRGVRLERVIPVLEERFGPGGTAGEA